MLQWICENSSTILVSLVLLAVVILVVCIMMRDKKQGKSSCGGNCASCGGCCGCHKDSRYPS